MNIVAEAVGLGGGLACSVPFFPGVDGESAN